jgi:hypothetical protein
VYGDQAYRSQADVIRRRAQRAKDFTNQSHRYNGLIDETKSKIRSRFEHAFWVSKVCCICQSSVSRPGEESAPTAGDARVCKPVHCPAPPVNEYVGTSHRRFFRLSLEVG